MFCLSLCKALSPSTGISIREICPQDNVIQLLSSLNSGVTGGGGVGQSAPETSDREISAELPGKERQGEKGKTEQKRRKIEKGRWEIENLMRKSYKMRRGPFLFLFFVYVVAFCFLFLFLFLFVCLGFFFFFCFSLFETTEICFGSTKIKIFYREKAFQAGKKIRKNDFAPLKNISLTPLSLN